MPPRTLEVENADFARRYFHALSEGASGETLGSYFHPDALVETFPNRLSPHGDRADLAAIKKAAERGARATRGQTYVIRSIVASGEQVALEVDWSATLAQPLDALPVGYVMRASLATFLLIRDGRIVSQRQYDCYQPW